jgi:precorrin-2/cobalt-factor-2 C20-methyltransferase
MRGTLYGVGLGPGDPELMTMKAVRILRQTTVIAYPKAVNGPPLARQIAAEYLRDGKTEIAIELAMTADKHPDNEAYDQGARKIAAELEAGRDVAVLCEGDPFFYGSFMYLFNRLGDRFNTEVIPGITSVTASADVALMPLVAGSEVFSVLPARLPVTELRQRLSECQSAAIIKLGRHGPKVMDLLRELDLSDQAYYVEYATMKKQKIMKVSDVEPSEIPYFATIVVRTTQDFG